MIVFGVNSMTSSLAIHASSVHLELEKATGESVDWTAGRPMNSSSVRVWVALWWKSLRTANGNATKIICIYDHESWRCDEFWDLLPRADALVAGSLDLLSDVRAYGIASGRPALPPCFIVPPGVNLDTFTLRRLPVEFSAFWAGNSWSMDSDGKGLQIAQDACDQAKVGLRRADIVGDDGERLNHRDMPDFYLRGSVLLVPSRSEGAPRTAIEAMAMGRPVIGTRVGLIPALVAHGLTGCIVKRDAESFANALLYMQGLLAHHGETVSELCRDSASRFSVDRCVRAWKLAIDGARAYSEIRRG